MPEAKTVYLHPLQFGKTVDILLKSKDKKDPGETAMLTYILRRLIINIPRLIMISIISFIIILLPTCSLDILEGPGVLFVQQVPQAITTP